MYRYVDIKIELLKKKIDCSNKNVLPHCDKPVNFPHDRKAFQENTPINNFISIFDL